MPSPGDVACVTRRTLPEGTPVDSNRSSDAPVDGCAAAVHLEVRQVQEMADFPPDIQKAASGFAELQNKTKR